MGSLDGTSYHKEDILSRMSDQSLDRELLEERLILEPDEPVDPDADPDEDDEDEDTDKDEDEEDDEEEHDDDKDAPEV